MKLQIVICVNDVAGMQTRTFIQHKSSRQMSHDFVQKMRVMCESIRTRMLVRHMLAYAGAVVNGNNMYTADDMCAAIMPPERGHGRWRW